MVAWWCCAYVRVNERASKYLAVFGFAHRLFTPIGRYKDHVAGKSMSSTTVPMPESMKVLSTESFEWAICRQKRLYEHDLNAADVLESALRRGCPRYEHLIGPRIKSGMLLRSTYVRFLSSAFRDAPAGAHGPSKPTASSRF